MMDFVKVLWIYFEIMDFLCCGLWMMQKTNLSEICR